MDVEAIKAAGLANGHNLIKVLANGKLEKKLSVTAHRFSASAKTTIEAAGGSCTALNIAPVADVPEALNSKKKKAPTPAKVINKAEEAHAVDDPEGPVSKEEEVPHSEEETDAAGKNPAEE